MKIAVVVQYPSSPPHDLAGAHRDYLRTLLEEEKIYAAGPMPEGKGALLVLEVASVEEANTLLRGDPYRTSASAMIWECFPLQYWSAREWKGK